MRVSPFAGLALCAFLVSATQAGGPLLFATNGSPVGWNVTGHVEYHTDHGGLGLLSSGDATALVESLSATWGSVATSKISFARTGQVAVDVDQTNFTYYLGPYGGGTSPIGENAIVFDADGAIFDLLYGVGTGVAGFAGPTFTSNGVDVVPIGGPISSGSKIIEGLVFLNGKLIDGVDDPSGGNPEVPLTTFKAVFVHEFGHFAGLDHTQIHGLSFPPESDSGGYTRPVETMFPFLLEESQITLERDDIVAISNLYPTSRFAPTTGRIAGRVLSSDGVPLSGVNVIARNIANDADAVSYVSGATLIPAGQFVLAGLTPGQSYSVEIQEIDAFHQGGSSVGPFTVPVSVSGPPEFYNGASESADPVSDLPTAVTPIVANAGTTIADIDVVLNRQEFSVENQAFEGEAIQNFALGDFDRDGRMDFVATRWSYFGSPGPIINAIMFYRGLGGGNFASPVKVDDFPGNKSIVATQLNPLVDSFLDIAICSESINDVRVYFGNGAGGFGSPITVLDAPFSDYSLRGLLSGHINADAFDDLFTIVYDSTGGATAYALLGNGLGSFAVVPTAFAAGSGIPVKPIAIDNFAGDAAEDVVGLADSQSLGLLVGDGAGSFIANRIGLGSITLRTENLAAGDFNEDGKTDLAISDLYPIGGPPNYTRSFIDVLVGDGSGVFSLSKRYAVPESFSLSMVASDFNWDGHLDIASSGAWFAPGRPGAKVTLAFGDGAGGISDVATVWGLSEFPYDAMVAGDLDGDGRADLLVNDGAAFGSNLRNAGSVLLNLRTPTDAGTDQVARARGIELFPNRPNPFNPTTIVRFYLSEPGLVSLKVYNPRGELVRGLVDGFLPDGHHAVTFEGRDSRGLRLASGVYFCELRAAGGSRVQKMVVTR